MPVCGYCGKHLPTTNGLKIHVKRRKSCYSQYIEKLKSFTITTHDLDADNESDSTDSQQDSDPEQGHVPESELPQDDPPTVTEQAFEPRSAPSPNDTGAPIGASTGGNPVDEVDSDRATRFAESYPGRAGEGIRRENTKFDTIREVQECQEKIIWDPFQDEEEWELARWLVQNMGQSQMDEFLKLPITRNRTKPSYKNRHSLNEKVDSLPTVGAPWIQEVITIAGTEFDGNGEPMHEEVELWYRDPVECVRELVGNPAFEGKQAYAPERVYVDPQGQNRMYDEMWTGDWWWETQSKLPPGATVAPVILASDKTQLSRHRGDKEAWPVYLTIGNIEKGTRRVPSSHAMILIGYLPIPELSCVSENAKAAVGYRLFHFCMRRILTSLVKAGSEGVEMVCADRWVRRIFPILAAYVADHPERCLIACCKQNRCPQCLVDPTELGDLLECIRFRESQRTKKILEHRATGRRVKAFFDEGLRPVDKPFWADLPHTDIFHCFMPDLLHQVHKGIIKDHLLSWCVTIAGKQEIDERFACMPDHPDIRHFKHGISVISQWTGRESRELEKVLLGALNGAVQPAVAKAARAMLDFAAYSQFHTQTDVTLDLMDAALCEFHEYKDVFLQPNIRDDFNFPKLHAIQHYLDSIKSRGSADGYNTELPERLHIDLAKDAYHATNKHLEGDRQGQDITGDDFLELRGPWLRSRRAPRDGTSSDSEDGDDLLGDQGMDDEDINEDNAEQLEDDDEDLIEALMDLYDEELSALEVPPEEALGENFEREANNAGQCSHRVAAGSRSDMLP
ncbi:hypothetical protein GLOTRDRAFT_133665 [Gloeophyllum trabeum ATCC 11539]|uniref:C2H2-type domain-containing protein n=1 Tax=Gloeophyllum trabeum (strain ATCC 11539 / FP-39264 / Madison 617) TaxID=670483 RepID=S7PU04_GLOTA|nr:uncharacterized protein GLOTRDRAFT_133665 [Gloeophyllum trabeum ATCC 11539]EPQ50928.1 hypothetical protein GLOTRDRAFT_133665 [Gloeophyllum trabeum ATCC 11539]